MLMDSNTLAFNANEEAFYTLKFKSVVNSSEEVQGEKEMMHGIVRRNFKFFVCFSWSGVDD